MPRSVAFSGKKKKAQLRDRREKKGDGSSFGKGPMKGPPSHFRKSSQEELLPEPYETLPDKKSGLNRHERFKLLFQQESREEVQVMGSQSLVHFDPSEMDQFIHGNGPVDPQINMNPNQRPVYILKMKWFSLTIQNSTLDVNFLTSQ